MTTLTIHYEDIAIEVEACVIGCYRAATQEEPAEYPEVEIHSKNYEVPQGDLTDDEYKYVLDEVQDYVKSDEFYKRVCDALAEEIANDYDDY